MRKIDSDMPYQHIQWDPIVDDEWLQVVFEATMAEPSPKNPWGWVK